MLRRAARTLAQARGKDWAKITSPRRHPTAEGFYTGRVLVWTEIDIAGTWLNLDNEEELPLSLKESISIPENARPNFRTFEYVFDNNNHTLYFESRNDLGSVFGPTTARRLFNRLLDKDIQGLDAPDVSVTVRPQDGAVDRILQINRLRILQIRVELPNPDTTTAAKRRVIERIRANSATRLDETYTKSSKADKLTPTEDVRDLLEVAAEDGFARGVGRDSDGKKLEISTSRLPAKYHISAGNGSSFISRLLAALRTRTAL